jgi:hypothetical protein
VAWTRGRDESRLGAAGQRVDHRYRVFAVLGQRPTEHAADACSVGARGDWTLVERREVCRRVLCRGAETGGSIRH